MTVPPISPMPSVCHSHPILLRFISRVLMGCRAPRSSHTARLEAGRVDGPLSHTSCALRVVRRLGMPGTRSARGAGLDRRSTEPGACGCRLHGPGAPPEKCLWSRFSQSPGSLPRSAGRLGGLSSNLPKSAANLLRVLQQIGRRGRHFTQIGGPTLWSGRQIASIGGPTGRRGSESAATGHAFCEANDERRAPDEAKWESIGAKREAAEPKCSTGSCKALRRQPAPPAGRRSLPGDCGWLPGRGARLLPGGDIELGGQRRVRGGRSSRPSQAAERSGAEARS
jgi:hypothetical protein